VSSPASDATILVRADGEAWREPSQAGYLSEADMQEMLAEQPSLIPGVGHQAGAAREFYTGVGPSDVVVVDLNGTITLVECKLASNVEIRRKIVGQVLNYAARL
jgi:RecB family endonuclease NucS